MSKEMTTAAVTVEEAIAARPDYENEIITIVRGTYSPKAAQSRSASRRSQRLLPFSCASDQAA